VVAEVNWSGGPAGVHAYHLGQFGVRFAPTEEERRRQQEIDARTVRRGFRPASEVLRICPWRSPQVVVVLVEGQRGQQLCWAQGVGEKRALLRLATDNDRVLAVHPFRWTQATSPRPRRRHAGRASQFTAEDAIVAEVEPWPNGDANLRESSLGGCMLRPAGAGSRRRPICRRR